MFEKTREDVSENTTSLKKKKKTGWKTPFHTSRQHHFETKHNILQNTKTLTKQNGISQNTTFCKM